MSEARPKGFVERGYNHSDRGCVAKGFLTALRALGGLV